MKMKKMALLLCEVFLVAGVFGVSAYAASGDVAGAIEGTWTTASAQIKTVVNNVIFPALDMILAILLFVKIGGLYMDYRKHGQIEWTPAAILFAGLIFSLTAPSFIWTILGI